MFGEESVMRLSSPQVFIKSKRAVGDEERQQKYQYTVKSYRQPETLPQLAAQTSQDQYISPITRKGLFLSLCGR